MRRARDNALVELDGSGGAQERSATVVEDPAVVGHQPVALARRGRRGERDPTRALAGPPAAAWFLGARRRPAARSAARTAFGFGLLNTVSLPFPVRAVPGSQGDALGETPASSASIASSLLRSSPWRSAMLPSCQR